MLKADLTRTIGAVVRQSDGLILGSFCCVAANHAMTAAHVLDEIENSGAIGLRFGDEMLQVERFWIDDQRGIASIVARLPYALSPSPGASLAVTSTVYVAGWPQLLLSDPHCGLRTLKTNVTRMLEDGNYRAFEVQGMFPKGFSGAAVLDNKGRLIGLLDELCALEVGPNLNFCYGLVIRL